MSENVQSCENGIARQSGRHRIRQLPQQIKAGLLRALRGDREAVGRILDRDTLGYISLSVIEAMLLRERNPGLLSAMPDRLVLTVASSVPAKEAQPFRDEITRRFSRDAGGAWTDDVLGWALSDNVLRDFLLDHRPLIESERFFRALVRRAFSESWAVSFGGVFAERFRRRIVTSVVWLERWAMQPDKGDEAAIVAALHALGTSEAFETLERLAAGGPSSVVAEVAARIGRPDGTPEEARRWFDYRLSRGRLGEVEAAIGGPHGAAAAAALFDRWPDVYRCRDAGATRVYIPE